SRRRAVELAETYADGKATEEQLRRAWYEADYAATPYGYDVYNMVVDASSPDLELNGTIAATAANHAPDNRLVTYCDLLRCIYGNPFRSAAVDLTWFGWEDSRTVIKLAEGVYEERSFDRLPILADALEDAGCTDAAILNHLRGPGPHVRGCWAL